MGTKNGSLILFRQLLGILYNWVTLSSTCESMFKNVIGTNLSIKKTILNYRQRKM